MGKPQSITRTALNFKPLHSTQFLCPPRTTKHIQQCAQRIKAALSHTAFRGNVLLGFIRQSKQNEEKENGRRRLLLLFHHSLNLIGKYRTHEKLLHLYSVGFTRQADLLGRSRW